MANDERESERKSKNEIHNGAPKRTTGSELHGADAGGIRAGRSMPIDERRTNTKLKKEKWEKAKLK